MAEIDPGQGGGGGYYDYEAAQRAAEEQQMILERLAAARAEATRRAQAIQAAAPPPTVPRGEDLLDASAGAGPAAAQPAAPVEDPETRRERMRAQIMSQLAQQGGAERVAADLHANRPVDPSAPSQPSAAGPVAGGRPDSLNRAGDDGQPARSGTPGTYIPQVVRDAENTRQVSGVSDAIRSGTPLTDRQNAGIFGAGARAAKTISGGPGSLYQGTGIDALGGAGKAITSLVKGGLSFLGRNAGVKGALSGADEAAAAVGRTGSSGPIGTRIADQALIKSRLGTYVGPHVDDAAEAAASTGRGAQIGGAAQRMGRAIESKASEIGGKVPVVGGLVGNPAGRAIIGAGPLVPFIADQLTGGTAPVETGGGDNLTPPTLPGQPVSSAPLPGQPPQVPGQGPVTPGNTVVPGASTNTGAAPIPTKVNPIIEAPSVTPPGGPLPGDNNRVSVNPIIENRPPGTPPGVTPPGGAGPGGTPPGSPVDDQGGTSIPNQNTSDIINFLNKGVWNDLQGIQSEIAKGPQSPDVIGMYTRGLSDILRLIKQQEDDLKSSSEKELSEQDPSQQLALSQLREQLEEQLRSTQESLNSRGLYQSGILLDLESKLRGKSLSAQAQLVSDRFNRIKTSLSQGLQQFRTKRIDLGSAYGMSGIEGQINADESEQSRMDGLMKTLLQGRMGLRSEIGGEEQQRFGREQDQAQFDARLGEDRRQFDEDFGMKKAIHQETIARDREAQERDIAAGKFDRESGGSGKFNSAATAAAVAAVRGAGSREQALQVLSAEMGQMMAAGIDINAVMNAINAFFGGQ